MENRSSIYVAIDHLMNARGLGLTAELIQPVELVPFDDKEYQLQLRLLISDNHESSLYNNEVDKTKVMDAVSKIRIDESLGVANEIVYNNQVIKLKDVQYVLVMTSTRIIDGDKLWNI